MIAASALAVARTALELVSLSCGAIVRRRRFFVVDSIKIPRFAMSGSAADG
jgi:hypothetical protein